MTAPPPMRGHPNEHSTKPPVQVTGPAKPELPLADRPSARAFAWARVSTDKQEEMGLSLPEQHRQIRQYAEKNGFEIVGEFQEAESGFRHQERRHEFHRM